jgi:hypothetical protein
MVIYFLFGESGYISREWRSLLSKEIRWKEGIFRVNNLIHD